MLKFDELSEDMQKAILDVRTQYSIAASATTKQHADYLYDLKSLVDNDIPVVDANLMRNLMTTATGGLSPNIQSIGDPLTRVVTDIVCSLVDKDGNMRSIVMEELPNVFVRTCGFLRPVGTDGYDNVRSGINILKACVKADPDLADKGLELLSHVSSTGKLTSDVPRCAAFCVEHNSDVAEKAANFAKLDLVRAISGFYDDPDYCISVPSSTLMTMCAAANKNVGDDLLGMVEMLLHHKEIGNERSVKDKGGLLAEALDSIADNLRETLGAPMRTSMEALKKMAVANHLLKKER